MGNTNGTKYIKNDCKNGAIGEMKDKIIKLIDEVRANSPNAEEIVVCGTEEYIGRIKEYLPQDVSIKIVPVTLLPKQKDNLVYIFPIEYIKPYNPQYIVW